MVCPLHYLRGMKTTKTKRVKIFWCVPIAGPLYRVQSEDDELYCYDWSFRVAASTDGVTADGRTFEHATHAVRGAVKNPEGYWVPNFNHKNEAEAFCQRVKACGSIDLAYWVETTGENAIPSPTSSTTWPVASSTT